MADSHHITGQQSILQIDQLNFLAIQSGLRTYFQGRNRDTDAESRLVDKEEEGEGGTNWESSIEKKYITMGKTDS